MFFIDYGRPGANLTGTEIKEAPAESGQGENI